jgi:hypothetical protein
MVNPYEQYAVAEKLNSDSRNRAHGCSTRCQAVENAAMARH